MSQSREIKNELNRRLKEVRYWLKASTFLGLLHTLVVMAQAAILAELIFDLFVKNEPIITRWLSLLYLPGCFLLKGLIALGREQAGHKASSRVRHRLRQDLLVKIKELGPAWLKDQQNGALATQFLEHVESLDSYIAHVPPQRILSIATPSMILLPALVFNWVVALIFLSTTPLIILLLFLLGKGVKAEQDKQLRSLNRMGGLFLDLIRGLPTLRLLKAHHRQTDLMQKTSQDFRIKTMKVLKIAFLSATVLEFFTALAIALTAIYLSFSLLGLIHFGVSEHLSLKDALFFLLMAPEFYLPLRESGALHHTETKALAAFENITTILWKKTDREKKGFLPLAEEAPRIQFCNVWFHYRENVEVIRKLHLLIEPGQTVAITGPSGCGKTTLLRLLLGQIQPSEGAILVNGIDISRLKLSDFKKKIAMVDQHIKLKNDTLAANLTTSKTNVDRLHEALTFAELETWVQTLPQGLETPLGEGGFGVSGGQLRRLALARLFLRQAQLLLLDEPTASLDAETKALMIDRLRFFKQSQTMIILTHHPEVLVLADRVVTWESL